MMDDCGAACLLLLYLPHSLFCGIDLFSFTLTHRFHGLKQIPQGFHFLFAAVNESLSLRQGTWFQVSHEGGDHTPEIITKGWDANTERFTAETAGAGLRRTENLTPYHQLTPSRAHSRRLGDWTLLTDCITASLLSRVLGEPEFKNHWTLSTASSAKEDVDNIPGIEPDAFGSPEGELRFLHIDLKQTWRAGAVGRERTEAARDRSWALRSIIQNDCNGDYDRVIGEMQLTFLMTLTLNNFSCMEQWKRILSLVLTCKADVCRSEQFFGKFLSTLQLQLYYFEVAEGTLFDMEDAEDNLLRVLLQKFRTGVEEMDQLPGDTVMERLEALESYLQRQFGWRLNEFMVKRGQIQLEDGEHVEMEMDNIDEQDERGEYAPMVVELSEEQARTMPMADIETQSLPFHSRKSS